MRKKGSSKNHAKDFVATSFGNWKLGITRNMSFWHQWLSSWGHYHYARDFGVMTPSLHCAITIDGTRTSAFFLEDNTAAYSRAVLESVETVDRIVRLKQRYKKFANDLLSSLEILQQEINTKNWDEFTNKYSRFCAGLFLTSTIGRAGITALTKLLEAHGVSESSIPAVIAEITYPDEHTPLFESRTALLAIGAQVQKGRRNQETVTLLREWLKRYGYIPVNFCEEPWTLKDAKRQVNEILQQDCTKAMKQYMHDHRKKIEQRDVRLKQIGNPKITVLAHAVAEGTYLNEYRKNVFSRASLGYRDIFTRIAAQGNSQDWRDCFFLLPDEMRSLIKGSSLRIKDIVQSREVVGHYIDESGNPHFIKGNQLKKFLTFIRSAHGKGSCLQGAAKGLVRGFSANKGKIEGTVRVIFSSKDFHRFHRGDILVTAMTSVDFMPIMEKAGAFVTNEGGLTSHASIVAREMNKPCIIGTKNATQALRDGDRVEVDAHNGIIRIIE